MPLSVIDTGLFGTAEKSGTSQSISTGVKTFTLDVDNGFAQTDYTVQIVSTADPDCWMYGVVTTKTTPNITVSVFKVSDVTGTFDDWDIQTIAGPFAGLPASQTLGFSTNSTAMPAVGDVLNWTIETGKAFYDNSTVYVSAVNDRTDFFFATVVSYTSGTGALKLVVNRVSGSGTNALWAISLIDVTQSFRTAVGNTNYTIKSSDKIIALTANLSAFRTWTLPLASSVPPGYGITILDQTGGISAANFILVVTSGSDTINGGSTSESLTTTHVSAKFTSDGVSDWHMDSRDTGIFYTDIVNVENDLVIGGTLAVDGIAALSDDLSVGGDSTLNGNILAANLRDSTTTFYANADATKKLAFQCSGITTGTTRTATWPDADITVVGTDSTQTLRNKSAFDNSFTFVDNLDQTKKFEFQASLITAGTTRTLNAPDASGTIVLDNNTATLTGKTIALGSNTVSGTTAQFNTALTDGDFATLAGSETLTNKTMSGPSCTVTGNLRTSSASAPIGYDTGAGSTVTQGTSNTTGVTINTPCGRITMFGTIAASTAHQFTVTNSSATNDSVIVLSLSNITAQHVTVTAMNITGTTFVISIMNHNAGAATAAAPIINYAIINGVTS